MKRSFLHYENRMQGLVNLLALVFRNRLIKQRRIVGCFNAIVFIWAISAQAQGPASQWDKAIPGMQDGQSELVVQTSQGDLVIGKISANASFQLLRVSNGGTIKLNKIYNGTDYTSTSTILATTDKGYLLGSKVNNASGKYYQMIKLNSDGQLQWKKKYGVPPTGLTGYQPVIQTTDGGFMIGAYTGVGIGGDKTEELKDLCADYYTNPQNCGYNSDYWILKVDQNGNKLWDHSFGGGAEDNLRTMIPTPDGGSLLVGNSFSIKSSKSTNKTSVNLGMDDIWLVKVSSNGSKQWDKSLGGNDQDTPKIVVQTANGGFLIIGDSYSGINQEKTAGINGTYHDWLVKVDKDGKYQWDKVPNWKTFSNTDEIIVATQDNGFLVGLSSDAGIGGIKSEASRGSNDYWMIKYNSQGNRQWDKRFGGNAEDKLLTLTQFQDASFQLFGHSKSAANGDKTVSSTGGWVVKAYPGAPTNLTATPVSANQINLQWKDNLVNESRYVVERAIVNSGNSMLAFNTVATLSGKTTSYADVNLPSNTTYAYRIRAARFSIVPSGQPFPPSGSSDFSSIVTAKLTNASVRITDFSPKSGPVGTEVIIKGYGFIDDGTYYVSDVKFNTKPAAPYGVESETEIRAKVAPGSTSGLISLLTPGGTKIVSETSFTVTMSLSQGNKAARVKEGEEWTDAETIRFYPNPAQNNLNLELPGFNGEKVAVSIYDLTGKLCSTFNTVSTGQVNQLNISGLRSGVYLLRIQSGYYIRNFRLVKQ